MKFQILIIAPVFLFKLAYGTEALVTARCLSSNQFDSVINTYSKNLDISSFSISNNTAILHVPYFGGARPSLEIKLDSCFGDSTIFEISFSASVKPRYEFLKQSFHQEASKEKFDFNGFQEIPSISNSALYSSVLLAPYTTPLYLKNKALLSGKGTAFIGLFSFVYEAASIFLILDGSGETISGANFSGYQYIGILGLITNRLLMNIVGKEMKRVNEIFKNSSYKINYKK